MSAVIIEFPRPAVPVKRLSLAERLRLLSHHAATLAEAYAALAEAESVSEGKALDEALQ